MKQFWIAAVIAYFISMSPAAVAGKDSLDIQNTAEKIGDKEWRWTAFVSGPPDEIGKIACVKYTLHPTFPKPVQEVCSIEDPKHPFALTATGWGTFNLRARIEFKDGTSQE